MQHLVINFNDCTSEVLCSHFQIEELVLYDLLRFRLIATVETDHLYFYVVLLRRKTI